MNLQTLASHTVDLDLLPDTPTVLDVGCRWFDFAQNILDARPAARVICMDPAPDVPGPQLTSANFLRAALVGSGNAKQHLAHYSTGEGDFLGEPRHYPGWDIQPTFHEVDCLNIHEVMMLTGVEHFDLVKLDCEGSEFAILENWPGPIATQISVEFHDWNKPQYRRDAYFEMLFRRLPEYRVVQHELSKQGTGWGHWDTLLTLNNGG